MPLKLDILLLFILSNILIQCCCKHVEESEGDYSSRDVKKPFHQMRVFDGEDSSYKQQKHLVRLRIELTSKDLNTDTAICSGSIISESWILSAAHCFMLDNNAKVNKIRVEVERRESNRWVKLANAKTENIITHPKFVHRQDFTRSECDLAVLKTMQPMKLSEDLKAIRLNRSPVKTKKTATIAGYGDKEESASVPRQGVVTVKPCEEYGRNLLCSHNLVRAGSGDSGGSLVSKAGTLVGVTSASCNDVEIRKKCESVFVDVAANLDWITSNTGTD